MVRSINQKVDHGPQHQDNFDLHEQQPKLEIQLLPLRLRHCRRTTGERRRPGVVLQLALAGQR